MINAYYSINSIVRFLLEGCLQGVFCRKAYIKITTKVIRLYTRNVQNIKKIRTITLWKQFDLQIELKQRNNVNLFEQIYFIALFWALSLSPQFSCYSDYHYRILAKPHPVYHTHENHQILLKLHNLIIWNHFALQSKAFDTKSTWKTWQYVV